MDFPNGEAQKNVYNLYRIRKNDFFVISLPQNVQKIYSPHPPLTTGQNQNPLFFEKSIEEAFNSKVCLSD